MSESLLVGGNPPLMVVENDRVVIDHGPFTSVEIRCSRFARWTDSQIADYHAKTAKWRRFGWLRWLGRPGRWVAAKASVPLVEPRDRDLLISDSTFWNGA